MASQLTSVSQSALATDRVTLRAIQSLSDFQPFNETCSAASLQQLESALFVAEEAEARAQGALDQARQARLMAARAFHDAARIARSQVIAQYGENSTAVQLVGLTRKSDYKRPSKRKVTE